MSDTSSFPIVAHSIYSSFLFFVSYSLTFLSRGIKVYKRLDLASKLKYVLIEFFVTSTDKIISRKGKRVRKCYKIFREFLNRNFDTKY
jgi:hypothetical protein